MNTMLIDLIEEYESVVNGDPSLPAVDLYFCFESTQHGWRGSHMSEVSDYETPWFDTLDEAYGDLAAWLDEAIREWGGVV